MKYQIEIGETLDLRTNSVKPNQTLIITEEQFDVIKEFAHTKRDADLKIIYILNDCHFRVYPYFVSECKSVENNEG